MKFKVKTGAIKEAMSIIGKGVGDSEILPVTQYINFKVEDGSLKISATDLSNMISYTINDLEVEAEGETVIHADSIIKLIKKTTKENMQFELKDNYINIIGNGNYKVGILDKEFPQRYQFPSPDFDKGIDVKELQQALKENEPSITKEMAVPVLSGYNVGQKVITTDGIKMSINHKNILEDSSVLMSQEMAKLVSTLKADEASFMKEDEYMLITTENVEVFGAEVEGINDYPNIESLLEVEYQGKADVDKNDLLSAMERLLIFSDAVKNNGIKLTFRNDDLLLADSKENSYEIVQYKENTNKQGEEVTIPVNIYFLRDLLKSFKNHPIRLYYTEDQPLQIEQNALINILGVLEKVGDA